MIHHQRVEGGWFYCRGVSDVNTVFLDLPAPNAGKTTTTSKLIHEACQTYGSEAVLVSSFTRTAARELVGRNLPLSDDQIGTLHAHCYRALDRPKLVSSTLLKDWNAEHPTRAFGGIGTDVDDPYANFETSGKQDGDTLLEELNRLRGLMVPEAAWPLRVQSFAQEWADFKSNTFSMDFTDLIATCVTDRLPIPHDAAVFFLDEVQDFSPLELSLGRAWGEQCEALYLAGDDDQCLYSFKGATPDAFLSPALPDEQVTVLGQSYRVPRAVYEAAVRWVSQIAVRKAKTYEPRPVDGIVDSLPLTYTYPGAVKEKLDEWIDQGKTVAFLASCSFFLDPLKKALREWGVPFHNPYRVSRGDWNPLGGAKRDMKVTLASDRVLAFRKPVQAAGWWTYGDLWRWVTVLEADGLFRHGAKTEIRRKAEAKETATLLADAADLESWFVDPDAADKATAGDLGWLKSKLLTAHQRPMEYACNVLETRGAAALTQAPQVILGTIHSVKGGEADVVVLFPDLSPAGYREWSSPGDAQDSVRRMFYVGMTRAKEALYWAQPCGMSIGGYI